MNLIKILNGWLGDRTFNLSNHFYTKEDKWVGITSIRCECAEGLKYADIYNNHVFLYGWWPDRHPHYLEASNPDFFNILRTQLETAHDYLLERFRFR